MLFMGVQRNKRRMQYIELVLKPALDQTWNQTPTFLPKVAATAVEDYRGNTESLSCVPVVFRLWVRTLLRT